MFCRKLPASTSLLAVLLMTGCDLQPIRDFAEASTRTTATFPPIAADMKASYVRFRMLEYLRAGDQLAQAQTEADKGCKTQDICLNAAEYLKVNTVLANYLRALGNLAADDLTNYDKQLDALSANIATTTKIKAEQKTAISDVVKFLVDSAASFYRQRKLASTMRSQNNNIKLICQVLADVGKDYEIQLEIEGEAMRKYYEGSVMEYQNKEPMSKLLLYGQYLKDRSVVGDRRQSAQAYIKAVQTISSAHADLISKNTKLGAKDILQLAASYTATIDNLNSEIHKAF